MRVLLIIIFLFFPKIVFGGIGDVYYCETSEYLNLKNGKLNRYKDVKFKFKRTSKKLAFKSNTKSFYQDFTLEEINYDKKEVFSFQRDFAMYKTIFTYNKGSFHFSVLTKEDISAAVGTCSIF